MDPSRRRWATLKRVDRVGILVGLAGFAVAALVLVSPVHLVFQGLPEHSIPFRVALGLPPPATWRPGMLVQFHVRNLRPYYPAGTVFTKIVAAVPGDRLRLEGRTFRVNGAVIGTARTTDSKGRPAWLYVPEPGPDGSCPVTSPRTGAAATVECTIPPGRLFVFGVHERSFDSRYFGIVTAAEVIGRVLPLL
jgi:type IV secretory pathway protease TraF